MALPVYNWARIWPVVVVMRGLAPNRDCLCEMAVETDRDYPVI